MSAYLEGAPSKRKLSILMAIYNN